MRGRACVCVGDGREYSSESAAAAVHMRITIQGVPRRRACEDSYIRALAPKALEKPATSVGTGACAWRGKCMKEGGGRSFRFASLFVQCLCRNYISLYAHASAR